MATKRVSRTITEERYHPPVDLSSSHSPGTTGTVATVTAAATGAGIQYVVTGATFSMATAGTAVSPSTVGIYIIDGAAGGTTYLWRAVVSVSSGMTMIYSTPPLNIQGSPNTALTAEFSGGVTAVSQAVTVTYHTIGPN